METNKKELIKNLQLLFAQIINEIQSLKDLFNEENIEINEEMLKEQYHNDTVIDLIENILYENSTYDNITIELKISELL